jgi:hypothetical protein
MTDREETDVRQLIQLTRELHKHLKEIEGETPSSELADEFLGRIIARVELHFKK